MYYVVGIKQDGGAVMICRKAPHADASYIAQNTRREGKYTSVRVYHIPTGILANI